jgi:predicted regulator of Ras-like GTPase activity (Roadblock/LC7/MglB family)
MGLFSNLPFLKRNVPEPVPAPTPEPIVEPVTAPAPEPEIDLVAVAVPVPEVAAPVAPVPLAAPEVSSQARAQAEEIVRSVAAELPDFITVAVVASTTGQILAGQWAGHSGGAVEVAAANAEMVSQARQAIEALQLAPTEQLEDIVITLRRQLHLLQVLPQQGWLLYLAIHTQDTNLALARTILRQHTA